MYSKKIGSEFKNFVSAVNSMIVERSLGHVDNRRSQRRIDLTSMKRRKLSAVVS